MAEGAPVHHKLCWECHAYAAVGRTVIRHRAALSEVRGAT